MHESAQQGEVANPDRGPRAGPEGLATPRVSDVTDAEEWDAFVRAAPGTSFCHLWGWRDVIGGVLGHSCRYLGSRSPDGGLQAVLPLVRVRSLLFGDFLVSMPFLNYGGPVGAPEGATRLLDAAVEIAREEGVELLELRTRHPVTRTEPLEINRRKVLVVLPLPEDSRTLWTDVFRSKLRSQIRRPQKEGLEVRFSDGPGPFYRVFCRHMRDLGTPVLPSAFFDALADAFPEQVIFGAVYAGDQPVAAGCGFLWQDEFEMTWAAALREWNRASPNMLLYWRFMEEATRRGARTFNFGRSSPGSGPHQFKRQWGGEDRSLPWLTWSPRARSATPNPASPGYALAARVWSRLPLGIANALGPVLARRIP